MSRTKEDWLAIFKFANDNGVKAALAEFKISSPAFYVMRKKLGLGAVAKPSKKSTARLQRHVHTSDNNELKMKIINLLVDMAKNL